MTTGARRSGSRPAPHCRVLPHGDFNGMIPEPLPVYFESFVMITVADLP